MRQIQVIKFIISVCNFKAIFLWINNWPFHMGISYKLMLHSLGWGSQLSGRVRKTGEDRWCRDKMVSWLGSLRKYILTYNFILLISFNNYSLKNRLKYLLQSYDVYVLSSISKTQTPFHSYIKMMIPKLFTASTRNKTYVDANK